MRSAMQEMKTQVRSPFLLDRFLSLKGKVVRLLLESFLSLGEGASLAALRCSYHYGKAFHLLLESVLSSGAGGSFAA